MPADLPDRIAGLDWPGIEANLNNQGASTTGVLLSPAESRALRALWPQETAFRSHVVMARHGFGQGEYQYFANPLPPLVAALRRLL